MPNVFITAVDPSRGGMVFLASSLFIFGLLGLAVAGASLLPLSQGSRRGGAVGILAGVVMMAISFGILWAPSVGGYLDTPQAEKTVETLESQLGVELVGSTGQVNDWLSAPASVQLRKGEDRLACQISYEGYDDGQMQALVACGDDLTPLPRA